MPYLRRWRLRRASNNLFWRHIEHGLKPEQDHAKGNQGKPVNLTEFPEKLCEFPPVSYKPRPFFLHTTLSRCNRSTPEEMCKEHHDTDYQQHVNYAAGNVKGQESKQPKND
jgi:hypothetical protein